MGGFAVGDSSINWSAMKPPTITKPTGGLSETDKKNTEKILNGGLEDNKSTINIKTDLKTDNMSNSLPQGLFDRKPSSTTTTAPSKPTAEPLATPTKKEDSASDADDLISRFSTGSKDVVSEIASMPTQKLEKLLGALSGKTKADRTVEGKKPA